MHTRKNCTRSGSLTIEAALALPVFMMALLTLVSLLFMHLAGQRIQALLHTHAQTLAIRCADGSNVSISDVGKEIAEELAGEDIRFIAGGREGIDMSGSFTDDPEYMQLCLRCELIPFTDMFGMLHIPYRRSCLVHVWNGYDKGFFPEEDYVYVTDESDVYHLDRDCSHIRLTIEEADPGSIAFLRNSDGKKYRSCEHCHAKKTDERLYITPEGDRFHNSMTCSALKRTVRAIRMSETGDRRPCRRCGR